MLRAITDTVVVGEIKPLRERDSIDYVVKHCGPQRQWCAIRLSDNKIVRDGFGTRGEAAGWIKSPSGATAA